MLTGKQLIQLFFRSFFIQAGWNAERKQSLGFVYTILPVVDKLPIDNEQKKTVLLRHLTFFNTHPYLATLIIGIISRLEEDRVSAKNPITEDEILLLKQQSAGPIAAFGDSLFWYCWRPFVAIVTVMLIYLFQLDEVNGCLFIPLLFYLIVYNTFHFSLRYAVLLWGYKEKGDGIVRIRNLNFQRWMTVVQFIIIGLITIILIIINRTIPITRISWYLLVFTVGIVLSYRQFSVTKLLYGTILGTCILYYLRVI